MVIIFDKYSKKGRRYQINAFDIRFVESLQILQNQPISAVLKQKVVELLDAYKRYQCGYRPPQPSKSRVMGSDNTKKLAVINNLYRNHNKSIIGKKRK